MREFISQACSFYLRTDHQDEILAYQYLSGLGANRIGHYYQCLEKQMNQYFLIQGHNTDPSRSEFSFNQINKSYDEFSNNFITGFCFNRDCSASDLQYALSSAQKYVELPFEIDQVISPSEIIPPYDIGTSIILSFLSILILIFLISTLLKIYFKKIKYKKDFALVQCFSLQNTIRLLRYNNKSYDDTIRVFGGVKFLTFIGILISHSVILVFRAPSTQVKQNNSTQYFYLLFYCIDLWLMISGFFLSYIALKQYSNFMSIRVHLFRILRRILRFWPLYIIMILFTWKITPFLGSGPLWGFAIDYCSGQCGNQLLNNIFMIQNFSENSCNSWLWVWQVDIQLCIIFTPLLLLYCRAKGKIFKFLFFFIQLLLIICSVVVPPLLQHNDNLDEFFWYMQQGVASISPFSRVGGYIVGYNLGILFFQFRKQTPKSSTLIYKILSKRIFRVFLVLSSIGLLSFLFYVICTMKGKPLQYFQKLILCSFHFLVPFLVCVLITPPLFGFNSSLKTFLQSNSFGLLSKLSMSAYGVHYVIQITSIYSRKTDFYINNISVLFITLYSLIPIFAISICFTALLQMPLFVGKKLYLKTPRITYFQH